MNGSSHSQLCKKNSCYAKLQGGPLDHNPRKTPVENSWIIILQNNSKCLLLNDKCHTRYCSVCYRRSRPEVFFKKGVLTNFAKFTGKHLCHSFFFHKVANLRPATLLKMRLWHRCVTVNFAKFLRTSFFTEHLRWLLLLLDEIQNTKKMKTRESKKRKFEKKVREIGWVVLIFLWLCLLFCRAP